MTLRFALSLAALSVLALGCEKTPEMHAQAPEATSASAAASHAAPMVALLTKADWCSICKANGARVTEVLGKGAKEGQYALVVNDITSDESSARSNGPIAAQGLTEVAARAGPGTISFVDPRTHKRLAEATVAHQNEELAAITAIARKRLASN